jgi:hypothetical protein
MLLILNSPSLPLEGWSETRTPNQSRTLQLQRSLFRLKAQQHLLQARMFQVAGIQLSRSCISWNLLVPTSERTYLMLILKSAIRA